MVKGKVCHLPFQLERNDHIMDCYLSMINLKGINCKNRNNGQYPDVPSTTRPIPHGPDLPVPEPDGNIEYSSDSEHDCCSLDEDNQPMPLTQAELNDLTQDLNLSKAQREPSVGTRNNILRVSRL